MKKLNLLLALMSLVSLSQSDAQISYPESHKTEVTDTYFGTEVKDPYRWLENDTSDETKAWVKKQNEVTQSYLGKIPYREKFKTRLKELLNYPRYSSPFKAGEYYLFSKNDGLQNQAVFYKQKGLTGNSEVFLDPNVLSGKGTVSVGYAGFSKDKKLAAYTLSTAGSDWSEIRIKEVVTNRELPDVIQFVKFSGAAWVGNGFYYSRYPEPVKGSEFSGQNRFHTVYFHTLGTPQSEDRLVYEDKNHPLRYHGVYVTEDERFLILSISEGTDGNEIWFQDLKAGDKTFKPLITGFENSSNVIDNEGGNLLVYTNVAAPNYRLVSVNSANTAQTDWKEMIPEKPELLQSVSVAGSFLFSNYLKDVTTRIYQLDRMGKQIREIKLPVPGSAEGFGGEKTDTEVFYTFTTFNYPPTIFKFDLKSGTSEVFRKAELKFNPEDYEVKQVFVPSKDGTKVPMFIVHKKGLKLDGNRPTLLYAYGGFNISLEPAFSPTRIAFLENDGVYVQANIRGGGEYGETWHKAGMLEKKQNVFDDFISCAEWLKKNSYTSSEKLAIQGGSNGGLLIGAIMTQRPDLVKVCIPQVGVLDMLRFQKFTVGWGWVDEYGSSDKADEFEFLYKYSPLHNIQKTAYPATLVTTADHDDRVVPAHSFKFIATLQDHQTGNNPVLIRIETDAGHGAGTALNKSIDQVADIYSFIFYSTGSTVKY
jgi:prolyl oligopeptidase